MRTGALSRAVLQCDDGDMFPLGYQIEVEILPPSEPSSPGILQVLRGRLNFFHPNQRGHLEIRTGGAAASVSG